MQKSLIPSLCSPAVKRIRDATSVVAIESKHGTFVLNMATETLLHRLFIISKDYMKLFLKKI